MNEQLAVQFAVWDRIKDIQSHTNIQIKNLAQFLIYLIEHGGQPLSVLKVVDFAELDKPTLRFVRQTVMGLLLSQEDNCKQVILMIHSNYDTSNEIQCSIGVSTYCPER